MLTDTLQSDKPHLTTSFQMWILLAKSAHACVLDMLGQMLYILFKGEKITKLCD